MTCRAVRAIRCAVGTGMLVSSRGAWAEEAHGAGEREPRDENVRVDLGLGLVGGLASSGISGLGALGGTGGLAGSGIVPTASVAGEVHLAGPAWLVVEGNGATAQWNSGDGMTASSLSGGLRAGPRFEWRVVERVDAGFHVLARGSVSHAEATSGGEWDSVDVGGVAGASIHFRATPVFGIRLLLDVVSAGYATASSDQVADPTSSGYAQVVPSPAIQLTFTF